MSTCFLYFTAQIFFKYFTAQIKVNLNALNIHFSQGIDKRGVYTQNPIY